LTIALPKSQSKMVARGSTAARTDARGMSWLGEQVGRVTHNMIWRTRFLSTWARRMLGLTEARKFNSAQVAEGMTFVLPGIESESIFTYGICDGLVSGGLRGAVRVFNWGLPFPGGYLGNLTRLDRNRRRGADLAREIIEYQDRFPGRPVHVVAHSGGCGVALFAVEALPEDRAVDSVVLLAAAISPTYDLRRALSRVRRGVLNSHSGRDWFILGLGTRFFGTTDRQFCDAAGLKGFAKPENMDAAGHKLYDEKLTQISWCEDLVAYNHWGGHITSASEEYLENRITPWINNRES